MESQRQDVLEKRFCELLVSTKGDSQVEQVDAQTDLQIKEIVVRETLVFALLDELPYILKVHRAEVKLVLLTIQQSYCIGLQNRDELMVVGELR